MTIPTGPKLLTSWWVWFQCCKNEICGQAVVYLHCSLIQYESRLVLSVILGLCTREVSRQSGSWGKDSNLHRVLRPAVFESPLAELHELVGHES